jgi:phosphate:Na+ symporter
VGQISYENALALAIGANVGTTITAIIGAMSSNIVGKRLAGAHLIFNVTTGLIAIIFMSQIMNSVDFVSNAVGIASDDYTLKLAVFHTIFNVIGVAVMVPFIGKLVVFLESTLKDKHPEETTSFDTAQYLNESVLELPATAMAAIVRETKHLYTNAFEIITHGLNLKRTSIISDMPLEKVVTDAYSKSAIDINDFYKHRIKGIYGEIIDFSTNAQSQMAPEDIEELYKIKLANRDIVEAVKDTKHLQKNLIKYENNSNEHIKEQYNSIKIGLAELLRNIDLISKMTEEDEIILLLAKAKVHMQRYDILANGTLDNLIRNDLVTNEMATSLMNDSAYAYNISKNFIAMAEVIFIDASSDMKDIAEEMMINDEDIDLILKEKDA